jgi:hypothetical membrane protein
LTSPAGGTPGWALVSSLVAPIALIGGWTLAARLQPAGYSSVRQTISALAADGAHDRLVMTGGLLVLGLCHLVTASGLRPAARPGRIALAVGGAATVAVAAFPQPQAGSSPAHIFSATIGFLALAVWPALAARRAARSLLAQPSSRTAALVLLGLLVWFGVALSGDQVGLAERVLAGAQALWPLAVVLSTHHQTGAERANLD